MNIKLTARQIQVLECLLAGKTNKEIAAEVAISENTVEYHLKSIFLCLGARNRTAAAIRYLELKAMSIVQTTDFRS